MTTPRITPFLFEGEMTVRVIERDGLPWFVAADVCRVLGITNARDSTGRLDEDEKGVALTDTLGGQQEMLIVSESGLFTLILRCREAMKKGTLPHRFRRWVTGEVLPAIRRSGCFDGLAVLSDTDHPTSEANRVRMVTEARHTFGERAAAQLWFKLHLPTVTAMQEDRLQSDLFYKLPGQGFDARA